MKPLIWKELRENIRWLPIGLVVVSVVCWMVLPSRDHRNEIVLLASELVSQLAIVVPLLAFALGVVQSVRDLQPAGGAYLNHRGVTASDIYFSKIVSGFVLHMTSVMVPLSLAAVWITYHGMWWHPMRLAQLGPAIVYAFAAFVMHPAAMLMMSRGASWWGTRLFPLVPAGGALAYFVADLSTGGSRGEIVAMLLAVPMLSWMILISRQSWIDLASDPPAYRTNSSLTRHFLLPAYLLIGTCCIFTFAVFMSIAIIEDMSRQTVHTPTPYTQFAVDSESGDPYITTRLQEYDPSKGYHSQKMVGADTIAPGKTVKPMSTLHVDKRFLEHNFFRRLDKEDPSVRGDGFFSIPYNYMGGNQLFVFDKRGYLLRYEINPEFRWSHTISADSVHLGGVLSGEPFAQDPISLTQSLIHGVNTSTVVADAHGVAVIEQDPIALRRIMDKRVDAIGVLSGDAGQAPRLFILEASSIFEYELYDENAGDVWFEESRQGSGVYDKPLETNLKPLAKLTRTFALPTELPGMDNPQFVAATNGLWLSVGTEGTTVIHLRPDGTNEQITFSIDKSWMKTKPDEFSFTFVVAGMIPGGLCIAAIAVGLWQFLQDPTSVDIVSEITLHQVTFGTWVASFLLALIAGWWLTRQVAQRCGLSRLQSRLWSLAVLLLGLAAPLAMVAIYRKVHHEPCNECGKPRRVDLAICENCNADWMPPPSEGVEIFDRAA